MVFFTVGVVSEQYGQRFDALPNLFPLLRHGKPLLNYMQNDERENQWGYTDNIELSPETHAARFLKTLPFITVVEEPHKDPKRGNITRYYIDKRFYSFKVRANGEDDGYIRIRGQKQPRYKWSKYNIENVLILKMSFADGYEPQNEKNPKNW